jgi:hypothetical protein
MGPLVNPKFQSSKIIMAWNRFLIILYFLTFNNFFFSSLYFSACPFYILAIQRILYPFYNPHRLISKTSKMCWTRNWKLGWKMYRTIDTLGL